MDNQKTNQPAFTSSVRALAGSGVAMDQKIHNPGKKWKRILLVSVQSIVDDSHMSGFRLDGAGYCMVHGGR